MTCNLGSVDSLATGPEPPQLLEARNQPAPGSGLHIILLTLAREQLTRQARLINTSSFRLPSVNPIVGTPCRIVSLLENDGCCPWHDLPSLPITAAWHSKKGQAPDWHKRTQVAHTYPLSMNGHLTEAASISSAFPCNVIVAHRSSWPRLDRLLPGEMPPIVGLAATFEQAKKPDCRMLSLSELHHPLLPITESQDGSTWEFVPLAADGHGKCTISFRCLRNKLREDCMM